MADVRPILSAYSILIRSTNLGLTVLASDVSLSQLDDFSAIQEAVDSIAKKQGEKGQ